MKTSYEIWEDIEYKKGDVSPTDEWLSLTDTKEKLANLLNEINGESKKGLRLDVGCGQNPSGDINTDLYIVDDIVRRIQRFHELNTKKIPNFVCCDVQHLPFKNETFGLVYCAHVIEHVKNPSQLLSELTRVSTETVIVEYPHRYGEKLQIFSRSYTRKWMRQHHIQHLSPKWFVKEAQKLNCHVQSSSISEIALPHYSLPFIKIPFFVRTTLRKK